MRIAPFPLCLFSALILLTPLSALAQCDPKTIACKSFIELAEAGDRDARGAEMACFYDGKTPSGYEDEFLVLVDRKKSKLKEDGTVFMADFANGQTVGLRGYGPMTKQEVLLLRKEKVDRLTYDTFDENQERKQISEVSYGADKTLQWVDTITIRKSTLRFQKTVEFYEENGGSSLVFTGRCYKIAHKANH
jgi:hypothetical protein